MGVEKMNREKLASGVHWQRLWAKERGRAGEQRSADVRGPVAATASEGREVRALLGRKLGRARWGAATMVLAGLASLGRAAGYEAHFFFSFFLFSVLFHLFEFKFGFGF